MGDFRFSAKQRHVALLGQRDGMFFFGSGPRQCGKTEAYLHGGMQAFGRRFTGHTGVLSAKTQALLDSNVLDRIRDWADDVGVVFERAPNLNKTWRIESYHGGWNYLMEVLGTDGVRNAAKKVQGKPIAFAYFDEFPNMPRELVEMVKGGMLTVPGSLLIGTMNPESHAHWAWQEYIKPVIDGVMDGEYETFQLYDNPMMTVEKVSQIVGSWSGVYFKRMALGLWVSQEGAVYPLTAANLAAPDRFEPVIRREVACDFGRASVSYAALFEFRRNGIHVADEWVHDVRDAGPASVRDQAAAMWKWANKAGSVASWVVPWDAHGFAVHLEDIYDADVVQAYQPEADGVNWVGLRLEAKDGMLLTIGERCERLLWEMENLLWNETLLAKGVERIDKTTADGGHATDAMRYQIATVEAVQRGIDYERTLA